MAGDREGSSTGVSPSTQTAPTADRPEQEIYPGERSQQSGGQPDQSQPTLMTVEETLTDEDVPFTWTDLRQARLPEYTLFHAMTISIDRKKGQRFTERHDRMLGQIGYTDMADSELVKVLEWMHLHRHDCKSLEKIVLQMLYHKRHSVSREFVDWSRYIIVVGGWVDGSARDETFVIAARTTLGGQLGSFKTLNISPAGIHDDGLYGGRCVCHPDLGVMFYCGGCTILGDPVKRCWMYNPATGKWVKLQPMSAGRMDVTLHVLPSARYIMAVGGWSEGYSLLSECEQFDLVTQTWRPVRSLPASRYDHAGVVCDDLLYVTGGNVGGDSPPTATVLVYGEVIDTWQDAPPMLHARRGHSAGTIPGSVVVCGGVTRADLSSANSRDVLSVEKFDTATRQWTIISHLHLGHSFTQGVCIDHRLLLLGGDRYTRYLSRDGRGNTRDVTVVDMTDGKVTSEPDKLPSAVVHAAVCVIRLPESVIDK